MKTASDHPCALKASRWFLTQSHQEHAHVDFVLTHDVVSPNGPCIRFVMDLGYHFIFWVKDSDHSYLFTGFDEALENGRGDELIFEDPHPPKRSRYFHWINGLPLDASRKDALVNLLKYWQVTGNEKLRFSWQRFCVLSRRENTLCNGRVNLTESKWASFGGRQRAVLVTETIEVKQFHENTRNSDYKNFVSI